MIRYLTLAEYFWLAEQVTRVDADTLAKVSRIELADSALHAPQASFGGEEFYDPPVHGRIVQRLPAAGAQKDRDRHAPDPLP